MTYYITSEHPTPMGWQKRTEIVEADSAEHAFQVHDDLYTTYYQEKGYTGEQLEIAVREHKGVFISIAKAGT